ncbi:small nuclear ribonucleoprotein G-like [Sorex fumeus]|uniref:small nuclear ribonucleoprotein G-like n=1 Tax=Sorex fumeus TaxID=62283 RepID=UPI0024ADFE4A|nr:small nuclear ribonucleoprotein G-like [Sorex fumeus]
MDKKLLLKLNGGNHVQGILREFDSVKNLAMDECVETVTSAQQKNIGMVVIRGNRINVLEALEQYHNTCSTAAVSWLLDMGLQGPSRGQLQ